MIITVFGASGKVGRLLVEELLRRGHQVTAFSHSHAVAATAGLRIVRGDVADRQAVRQAIEGSQAVVSVLGSWGAKGTPVLTTAIERIVPAMEQLGVKRIVSLTGDLASLPRERRSIVRAVSTAVFNLAAPRILRDGDDHLAALASSQLDWTVLRSPVMASKGRATYVLTDKSHGLSIPRPAVVQALADLVESADWPQAAPFISRG